jgi:hypothetical protein
MRTDFFRVGVSLALFLVAVTGVPAPAMARSFRGKRATEARATPAVRTATASVAGSGRAAASTTGRTESRLVFVMAPGFVGPILWDPFWSPGLWDWWGPAPYAIVQVVPTNVARLSLHVRPRKADLMMDGSDQGEARDYAADYHPLWLSPGPHALELRFPGYQTLRVRLEAQKGQIYDLHYRLYPGEGMDRRSSVESTEPSRARGEHAAS